MLALVSATLESKQGLAAPAPKAKHLVTQKPPINSARHPKAVHLPSGNCIFDVVTRGIDEDAALIPGAALDPDVLVDVAEGFQLPVADHDGW